MTIPQQPQHPEGTPVPGNTPVPQGMPASEGMPAPQYPPGVPEPGASDPGAPQASWPWAKPVRLQTVETEPLEYHRLYRGIARYRWWKPLVVLLLAVVYYFTLSFAFAFALLPLLLFAPSIDLTTVLSGTLDTQDPLSVLFALGSVVLMIPAVWLAMLSVGIRPRGRGWSVALRLRWGLIWKTFGLAVAALVVTNIVTIGVGLALEALGWSDAGAADLEAPEVDLAPAMWSLLIVLVLVPLQATAEELAFRGLLMQVIGSWLRRPWLAILLPTLAFALMHIYDIWGLLAVGSMGLVAAWLTWRTGGLEAAISLHVVNNLIAFGLMAAGLGGSTAQEAETGGTLWSIAIQAAGMALYAWCAVVVFRRGRYERTRIERFQVEVPIEPGELAAQQGPVAPVQPAAPGDPEPPAGSAEGGRES